MPALPMKMSNLSDVNLATAVRIDVSEVRSHLRNVTLTPGALVFEVEMMV
jgi:hypothetical protein